MKLIFLTITIFIKNGMIYIKSDLIEFILPLENIEIIQNINNNKNNLFNLEH